MDLIALYSHMPVWIQNRLLSLKSRIYQGQRRGGKYTQFMESFQKLQWLDEKQITEWQRMRFRQLFSEAYSTAPYFKKAFDQAGFKPEQFESVEQLRSLPTLEKQQLRDNPEDFLNPNRKIVYTSRTGGTTGASLVSPYDAETMQYTFALLDQYLLSCGINYKQRCLYLTGQPIVPHSEKKTFWRHDKSTNSLFCSVHHLSQKTCPAYLDAIAEFQPIWCLAYPSFVYELARTTLEAGQQGRITLSAVAISSEMVTAEMRSTIEKAFNTKVYDFYSSTEFIPFIGQCPAGSYHIHPASGYVEFIDSDGNPAKVGEAAEMVMTSFRSHSRPILRYLIRDTAILSDKQCPCGCHWPVVEQLCGRVAEWVENKAGKRISQFSHQIFKVISNVRASQIIQHEHEKFTIKLVVNDADREQVETDVRNRMPEVLGHESDIKIEFVNEIQRTKGGKMRTVISEVVEKS